MAHCVACIKRMHGSCSECSSASIRPIVLHVLGGCMGVVVSVVVYVASRLFIIICI